jgi:fatty acid desaturase
LLKAACSLLNNENLSVAFDERRLTQSRELSKRRLEMLWTILVILLVLWLLGFIAHVGGGLIHLILVVALVVFVINLLSGRRAV